MTNVLLAVLIAAQTIYGAIKQGAARVFVRVQCTEGRVLLKATR